MVVIHGLKSCDTCRKALRELREFGRDASLRDLRAQPPEAGEVAQWRATLGPDLLNKRSATWRALTDTDRAGDVERLLLSHPTLIKRPVIADGSSLYLGWNAEVRAALGLS